MLTRPTERHPAGYDYRARFPALELVRGFEGGAIYRAEENGLGVLISDESTMTEFLSADDADLIAVLVSIEYFESVADLDAHIEARFRDVRSISQPRAASLNEDADASTSQYRATPELVPTTGFKTHARERQARFRDTLSEAARTPTDAPWNADRYTFLLALGHEDETLFPPLRATNGARDYFRARGARWWRSPKSGDATGGIPPREGPTRNLTSSQVACVNLLLPLREAPDALVALLQTVDPEIVAVTDIPVESPLGAPLSSYVELEWTGRSGTLEGSGSRGAHATSADACLIGITATGERRVFLFEFKYTEAYRVGEYKGDGKSGQTRKTRYAGRYYEPSSPFLGDIPLEDLLYDPFYQIMRLGLLGAAMVQDTVLGITDARVVVVCPNGNTAYRNRITSPPLAERFPTASTVEEIAHRLWKRAEGFTMLDPSALVGAVRIAALAGKVRVPLEEWSDYLRLRYGW